MAAAFTATGERDGLVPNLGRRVDTQRAHEAARAARASSLGPEAAPVRRNGRTHAWGSSSSRLRSLVKSTWLA